MNNTPSQPGSDHRRTNRTRNLLVLWLGWVILLFGFQELASYRLALQGPDASLDWTSVFTMPGGLGDTHGFQMGRAEALA